MGLSRNSKGNFRGRVPIHGHFSGRHSTPTYQSYAMMFVRCTRSTHQSFPYYGGRGITVCERWQSFETFLLDMGQRPPGSTLDRINCDGNYEPGNCRWASHAEQTNNRRSCVVFEMNGETRNLKQWCVLLGLPYKKVWRWLKEGKHLPQIITKAYGIESF